MSGENLVISDIEELDGYLNQIKKSRELIVSDATTEVKEEMKMKLISCIEKCSNDKYDKNIAIDEIVSILNDDVLLKNLSDKEKGSLFANLGYNYFLLGNFEKAIHNYKTAKLFGNKEVINEITYINIYMSFSELKGDIDLLGQGMYESVRKGLEEEKINYFDAMSQDFKELLTGDLSYIENPKTVESILYNYEITESLGYESLNLAKIKGEDDDYEKNKEIIDESLRSSYEHLSTLVPENESEGILELYKDVVSRTNGEEVDFSFYSTYQKQFLLIGFDMIEICFKEGKEEEGLKFLNLILKLGFNNLGEPAKGFILEFVKGFILGDKNEGIPELKESHYEGLFEVLSSSMTNLETTYENMLEIGDIFLAIKKYNYSLHGYFSANTGGLDIGDKIVNLLENYLFEDDIFESHNSEYMITINLLIDKLKNKEKINNDDHKNLVKIFS